MSLQNELTHLALQAENLQSKGEELLAEAERLRALYIELVGKVVAFPEMTSNAEDVQPPAWET
jgi:hypothetical protein